MDNNQIQEAYNQYWEQVQDAHIGDGWISIYKKDWGDVTPRVSKMDLQHSGMFWRFRTLSHLPDLHNTLKLKSNGQ